MVDTIYETIQYNTLYVVRPTDTIFTVHYDLIHVNTIQCDINIIQYNTIPIDTLQFDTTQYNCTIYHVRCILLVYNVQCTMYDVSICKYMYLYYVFVRTSVFVYVCTCIVRTSVFVYVCTCICTTCKSLCSLDKMNSGPKKIHIQHCMYNNVVLSVKARQVFTAGCMEGQPTGTGNSCRLQRNLSCPKMYPLYNTRCLKNLL